MLTTVVLAKDEAKNLPDCLESLKFCDHMVVVDTGSTDESVVIAKRLGAEVLKYPLAGDYAGLRNWALDKIKSQWVLFVDADERVSTKLADEISQAVTKVEYKGYLIHRVDYMWGKALKHGDVGWVNLLRLARRGSGKWVGKVHETWQVEGRIGQLHGQLEHYPHPTMAEFLDKINLYSTIRAKELKDNGEKTNVLQIALYPVFKFGYLYLVKMSFLDGTAGFIHAMTMALYTFLVRGKLWLLYKGIK